jgi:heat shock protein HtpX
MTANPDTSRYAVAPSTLSWQRVGANKRETWLLLFLFVVLMGGLVTVFVFALGLPIGAVGVLGIVLILYAMFSYVASSRVVLSISGAHEVTKEEEWEFVRRVENLAIGSGLPMPRTWVIEDSAPNAFATGTNPSKSHVVVTRGLLNKLEPIELEGVLAHEMSHIGNYDIRVMTITVLLVGVVALLSDLLLRFSFFGSGNRRSNRGKGGGGGILLIVVAIVAAILAPLIAQILRFAISRKREYLADASGAYLCRNPDALARALEKIRDDHEPLEVANKATAHLYFSNPLREHMSGLNNLFNTHPPIEERIRLLRSM